jgi:hypothetical protein
LLSSVRGKRLPPGFDPRGGSSTDGAGYTYRPEEKVIPALSFAERRATFREGLFSANNSQKTLPIVVPANGMALNGFGKFTPLRERL